MDGCQDGAVIRVGGMYKWWKTPAPGKFVPRGGKAYIKAEGESEGALKSMREDHEEKIKDDGAVIYSV